MKVTVDLDIHELQEAIKFYLNQSERSPFLGLEVPNIASIYASADEGCMDRFTSKARISIHFAEK